MKANLKLQLLVLLSLFSWQACAEEKIVDIQTFSTKNGVPVYLVERNDLPMVDIAVLFDAGSRRDDKKPGRAGLTGKMLSQGTAKFSADEIANRFENVGAQFGTAVGRDSTVFSLRTLTEPAALEQSLAMFTSVITQPSFPEKQFQRLQKQTLMGLKLRKQSANTQAVDLFYQNLYPTGPYQFPVSGTEASIAKITLKDLTEFYRQYYVTGSAKVVIVGNVNLASAKDLAENLTQHIASGDRPKAVALKVAAPHALQVRETFPGPQTAIVLGQLGIKRDDPNFYVLEVGNAILGGIPFYSRLFEEVREKQGLSYSVSSDFSPMKQTGPFSIMLQTQNENAAQAIKVTQDTVNQFIQQGPSENELMMAKKNISGQFPLTFASNASILQQLVSLAAYDLPLDYFDTYRTHINNVTQAQIQQAFKQLLLADHWLLVQVGAA